MENNALFRVNTPTVSHETIEGEAVIINLDNGNYYSLTDAGSAIWSLLVERTPVPEICKSIAETYRGDDAQIARGVDNLISQLQQENLIVAANGSDTPAGKVGNGTAPARSNGKAEFTSPVLQKYTDMQELLLLDPIHDVDDMGWPLKPE